MNNIIKKSSLIILVLLLCFVTSCAGNVDENDGGNSEETAKVDFDGMEFLILTDKDGVLSYKEDTVLADSLTERIKNIEESANCKILFDKRTTNDIVSYVPASVASGINCGDIFFIDAYTFRKLGNGDYLLDIKEYADIVDYKDSFRWGTKSTLELMTCNGVLCGVAPASWIDHLTPYYFLVVANDSILIKNNFAPPVEYYEKKQWTPELFEDVVKTCYDEQSGIFGLETSAEYIARMALYSNGYKLVDENGQNGLYSDNAKVALDWASEFLKNNKKYIANTGETLQNFTINNSALCLTDAIRLCQIVAFADIPSFTVLPFPSGKSVEYGTMGGFLSTNMCCIGIPVNAENVDESAYLINNIFAPMDGMNTKEDLRQYYTTNLFFHESDIDIVFKLAESAEYNYWVENAWDPVSVITSGVEKKTAAELIEANAPKLDKYLEDYIIPNKQGLASYFGD